MNDRLNVVAAATVVDVSADDLCYYTVESVYVCVPTKSIDWMENEEKFD